LISKVQRRFHKESDYFEKLGASQDTNDKFIYESLTQKIKFFQPAFHSTTPEGFNSRLTFLQQCTRQGPTNDGIKANNLAFGAPPVCILRIGDFYNTKIIIENLSFKFEPLVWDLNPEGVGVQPMIANVSMSFKFIGGRKDLRAVLEDNEYFGKTDKSSNQNLDRDQEAIADKENQGGEAEPSSGTTTDLDIIRNIAWDVDFNDSISSGVPNTFIFTWNAATPLSNLTKQYNYTLTIKNVNGAPQQVLTGVFGPETSNTGDNVSTTIWGQATYGVGDQTFNLTFKGNGLYYTRTEIIDPEII
jgi:hypothetical protein